MRGRSRASNRRRAPVVIRRSVSRPAPIRVICGPRAAEKPLVWCSSLPSCSLEIGYGSATTSWWPCARLREGTDHVGVAGQVGPAGGRPGRAPRGSRCAAKAAPARGQRNGTTGDRVVLPAREVGRTVGAGAMVGLVSLVAFAAVMTEHVRGSDRWLVNGALAGASAHSQLERVPVRPLCRISISVSCAA